MKPLKVSPFAPAAYPSLPPIAGMRFATVNCGIRYKEKRDLLFAALDENTTVAGVLTASQMASAPVLWCRKALREGKARALVANSGNSYAFTGKAGEEAAKLTAETAAGLIGCKPEEVTLAATGVIGEPLPHAKVTGALPALYGQLKETGWEEAAEAIMTTDTFKKMATRKATIDGVEVTLNGFAKGSGMIAPNMATMLAFVFTDAAIPSYVLQQALVKANNRSFNSITVDGDCSTSDTALLFATGKARHKTVVSPDDAHFQGFYETLESLMVELAQLIVKDGEGATKFVEIKVTGAESEASARAVGLAIGNSPLVKTAIAGEDANWGRIVMAVGKTPEKVDPNALKLWIGGEKVAENGGVVPGYDETPVAKHMKGGNILIHVDLGVGKGEATIWTCDLTHGYIEINADYRS